MKDYICIDVQPDTSAVNIYEHVTHTLPEFQWRRGNSDMQGPYISGVNADKVHIKLWLGETPVAMSISFASVLGDDMKREQMKIALIEDIKQKFLPLIGEVINISD